MTSTVYLDGDPVQYVEEDTVRVSLEFGWDTGPQYRCSACGADLVQTPDGFTTDGPDGGVCPDYDPADHDHPGQATTSGRYGEGWHDHAGDDDAGEAGRPGYGTGPHAPERVPLSWVNSATVDTDGKDDSVTVSVSVGDPRGAFCFTVRRVPDHAEGDLAGRLLLHVPYPGEPLPHQQLTAHHPGTYLIG